LIKPRRPGLVVTANDIDPIGLIVYLSALPYAIPNLADNFEEQRTHRGGGISSLKSKLKMNKRVRIAGLAAEAMCKAQEKLGADT
ncbi:hypothetical protein FRB94_003134, partial [Tulasnella sp. JGI-2019a]